MGVFRTTIGVENPGSRGHVEQIAIHAGGTTAVDHVVFGSDADLVLIGARCLEGLNLRVDPQRKQLIDAGPIVTAAA